MFLKLNELRSALQKSLANLQKTINLYTALDEKPSVETARVQPRPKAPAPKSSTKHPAKHQAQAIPSTTQKQSSRVATLGVLVIVVIGCLVFSYFQLTKTKRQLKTYTEDQLAAFSPYVSSVKSFQDSERSNLKIEMKSTWVVLSDLEQERTLKDLVKTFQTTGTTLAKIYHNHGPLLAVYQNQKLRVLPKIKRPDDRFNK